MQIIFLARDPRGIANSRLEPKTVWWRQDINEFEKVLAGIDGDCKSTKNILQELNQDEWLKNRTLVIRYEDMATEPVANAKVNV